MPTNSLMEQMEELNPRKNNPTQDDLEKQLIKDRMKGHG